MEKSVVIGMSFHKADFPASKLEFRLQGMILDKRLL